MFAGRKVKVNPGTVIHFDAKNEKTPTSHPTIFKEMSLLDYDKDKTNCVMNLHLI